MDAESTFLPQLLSKKLKYLNNMKTIKIFTLLVFAGFVSFAQNNLKKDVAAIKALAGTYKVSFNYAETFSPVRDYEFHNRHRSLAKELALIVEESPKKIVIQHLLVIRDSMIIKHWREDWTYEDPSLLVYDRDNTWKNTTLKPEDYKGKWTQKVYQVDDSPRYEAIGTWTHVDGRSQWISFADSPLPRREHTERNDYNVLNRRNFVYITPKGWMFEQDNKKILRDADGDNIIAEEKGFEEFVKTEPERFAYAKEWWGNNQAFWKDVRSVWTDVFNKNQIVKLAEKADGKLLYVKMMELNTKAVKEKWSSTKNKEEALAVINQYLNKG